MIVATMVLMLLAATPAVSSLLPRSARPSLGVLNLLAAAQLALLAGAAVLAMQSPSAEGAMTTQAALVITATLAAGLGGSGVSTAVLDSATLYDARGAAGRRSSARHAGPQVASTTDATGPLEAFEDERPVLRGGTWIGVLERFAVVVTLLSSWPEGLAIVLAVKGLARYSELKRPNGAAERFIIGTFCSVLWASACAGIAMLAL